MNRDQSKPCNCRYNKRVSPCSQDGSVYIFVLATNGVWPDVEIRCSGKNRKRVIKTFYSALKSIGYKPGKWVEDGGI